MVSGYYSARLYKTLKGLEWKKAAFQTAILYPGLVFGISFFLNFFIWGKHSSGAVRETDFCHFSTNNLCNLTTYFDTSVVIQLNSCFVVFIGPIWYNGCTAVYVVWNLTTAQLLRVLLWLQKAAVRTPSSNQSNSETGAGTAVVPGTILRVT